MIFDSLGVSGADPGYFPRGGSGGKMCHRDSVGRWGKVRRGVWVFPKKIWNMKCSRSDSEHT